MHRTLYLGAALFFVPPPVLAQQMPGQAPMQVPQYNQQAQEAQSRGAQAGTQSKPIERPTSAAGESGLYASEEDNGGGVAEILDRLARSGEVRERLASGIERVERACGADIDDLCGDLTPGEGRIALCMRAHSDMLSTRCRATLWRVSRNVRHAVSSIAGECLSGLQSQCGNAQNIGECAEQKSASISPSCHTAVAALRQAGEKLAALQNMPVYSEDGRDLGRVVEVQRDPQGKLQSVQIQIGRFLGIGDKVVTIGAGQIQQLRDRIMLRLNADQVRQLPEAKGRGM